MLARYILCDGPMLVRPSVRWGAEGPRDAKSCRGTRVATSSYMRPIATDAQQWRGRSIHAAYCYRPQHWHGRCIHAACCYRPQQWRGWSIHAAYCYRRAAVAWSVLQALPCFVSLFIYYKIVHEVHDRQTYSKNNGNSKSSTKHKH